MKRNNEINNNPLVSVIVPAYNAEKYIKRCVDSLVKQTYRNLEIIVVNDGSTDNTTEILREYEEKYSFIKVINKENEGVSKARNVALEAAAGSYLGFVDSDDYVDEMMYEELVSSILSDGSDMAVCGAKSVFADGTLKPLNFFENNTVMSVQGYLSNMAKGTYSVFYGALWNKLYSSEVFYNIKLDEGLDYAEDFAVNVEVLYNINKISICKNELYYYSVENQESLSRKKQDSINIWNINSHKLEVFRELCKYKGVESESFLHIDKAYALEIIGPVCYYVNEDTSFVEKVGKIKKLLDNDIIKEALNNITVDNNIIKIIKKHIVTGNYKKMIRQLYIREKMRGILK